MSHRLPPLNGLRSFEAAARHLSFTRAADELCVTPGAVSQQVKSLEGALGVALFRRLPRSLVLTDEGEAYLPAIISAFDIISKATESTAPALQGRTLRLGIAPQITRMAASTVRKLRQALHDSPDAPTFIETVSGRGYRFIADVQVVEAGRHWPCHAQVQC